MNSSARFAAAVWQKIIRCGLVVCSTHSSCQTCSRAVSGVCAKKKINKIRDSFRLSQHTSAEDHVKPKYGKCNSKARKNQDGSGKVMGQAVVRQYGVSTFHNNLVVITRMADLSPRSHRWYHMYQIWNECWKGYVMKYEILSTCHHIDGTVSGGSTTC